ncbi:MAG: hypothetical protein AAGN66_29205, partial [Acidobacteriota bacterium]
MAPQAESSSPRPPSPGGRLRHVPPSAKRWLGNLTVLGMTLALTLGAYVWRHGSYVRTTRFYAEIDGRAHERQDFGPLDAKALLRLGTAQHRDAHPETSYLLRPEAKTPGTVRIGFFGCSFVYGEEAPRGRDQAMLLEARLQSAGHDVEVLNFGVRGYGIQQAYLLWQELAPRYDLDLVIFGLHRFHPERDATFVQLADAYGPVHARYVLDDDAPTGLRLVPTLGVDPTAASKLYFGLPTPWRYLRYDVKTPPFLRSLLPRGRDLGRNPLYHHDDPDVEVQILYTRMMRDVAASSPRLLVVCDAAETCAFGENVGADNAFFFQAHAFDRGWKAASLLRAPEKHPSAVGYDLAAEELFLLLTGGDPRRIPRPALTRLPPEPEPGTAGEDLPPLSLWGSADLVVRADGVLEKAGAF